MRNSLKGLSLVLGLVFCSCTAKEKPIVKEEFKEPVKIKVKEYIINKTKENIKEQTIDIEDDDVLESLDFFGIKA